jgi:hypothetical protein
MEKYPPNAKGAGEFENGYNRGNVDIKGDINTCKGLAYDAIRAAEFGRFQVTAAAAAAHARRCVAGDAIWLASLRSGSTCWRSIYIFPQM